MPYEFTRHQLQDPPNTGEEEEKAPITRQDILRKDGSSFVLHNVLSPSECRWFIEQAEGFGLYECEYGRLHPIRITARVAARSESVADMIFDRIRPFLDPCIDLRDDGDGRPLSKGVLSTFRRWRWYPIGLNEVFRLCRYRAGGYFLPHHDGGYVRNEFERSMQTVMIYLNDEFEGGATNFYNERQVHYAPGDAKNILYSFRPRAGDVLVFNSAMTHDGGRLDRGTKYIMRSEVMYTTLRQEGGDEGRDNIKPDHDSVDSSFVPDGY